MNEDKLKLFKIESYLDIAMKKVLVDLLLISILRRLKFGLYSLPTMQFDHLGAFIQSEIAILLLSFSLSSLIVLEISISFTSSAIFGLSIGLSFLLVGKILSELVSYLSIIELEVECSSIGFIIDSFRIFSLISGLLIELILLRIRSLSLLTWGKGFVLLLLL